MSLDSSALDPGFSTARTRRIWSARARLSAMLATEVALTRALAAEGLAPASAGEAVARAGATLSLDAERLHADGWARGTPVLVLVEALQAAIGEGEIARSFHRGATSQDILDTATMLQLRASFGELAWQLGALADQLHARLVRHGHAPVLARTLLQPALPHPFSVRVVRWLEPVLARLETAMALATSLPVQLGGPIGDLGGFADRGDAVVAGMARLLGLRVPRTPWHTDRAPVREAVHVACDVAATVEGIAHDLVLLAQPEIGEIVPAAGASSSMPHKRNPIDAVRAIAAARACHGLASVVTTAPAHELERAAGSWQAEWMAVPLLMQATAASVEATLDAVTFASFDAARARQNVQSAPVVGSTGEGDARGSSIVTRVVAHHLEVKRRNEAAFAARPASLSWEDTGSPAGRAVVLLHALGTDGSMWREMADALGRDHRVLTVDLRGHGRSPAPPGPYSVEDLATDVEGVLDAAGARQAHVIGLSLGGLVGLWLAVHRPARVASLVAANTGARIGGAEFWTDRVAMVEQQGLAALSTAVLSRWFAEPFMRTRPARVKEARRVFAATSPTGYAGCCAALGAADLRADVQRILCPTLLVAGTLDVATPPAEAKWLHDRIAKSELCVIEGAAHLSCLDQEETFTTCVQAFLKRVP